MINISGSSRSYWKESGFQDHEKYILVNCCGYQKFLTRDFKIARHQGRVDYQIIYLIKGSGYYEFDNEIIKLEEGSVIVFTPGQPQHYHYRLEDSTELYWIHFTGYGVEEELMKVGLLGRRFYSIGVYDECTELLAKIMQELQLKKPLYMQYSVGYFLQLLACIARKLESLTDNQSITNEDSFSKIIAIMHLKYNEAYSAEYYAKMCNLGVYSFIHKFKKLTGLSPLQYITKIRMEEAKYLISRSSLSIKEVSDIVGYENPLYFSRVFKNVIGVSPSFYKKNTVLQPE